MMMDTKPADAQSARWYAVKCQPHRESAAAGHLAFQEFPVFLPRLRRARRHARKLDMVLAPLFPSYLFIRMDLSRDRWRCVNGTYGVSHLVMQGAAPVAVPCGIVETLQAECDSDGVLDRQDELKPGQPVRVLAGAFADFVGELERLDAAGRVRVLLNILGGPTSVVLPRDNIIAENSPG